MTLDPFTFFGLLMGGRDLGCGLTEIAFEGRVGC